VSDYATTVESEEEKGYGSAKVGRIRDIFNALGIFSLGVIMVP
jgi:hypothetical protein